MEAEVPPQPDSVYAAEGTCAHELAEIKARLTFGQISQATFQKRLKAWRKSWSVSESTEFEMDAHTDAYVTLIQERRELYPNTQVMVEQRLNTGVPQCWGTSDTVLASPQHVEIIDFKYGSGVMVNAVGNSQLRLYACGALDTYGDLLGETELVRITVHQPRLNHILTDEMSPAALREWRESILPVAAEALGPNARFGPSESACRWCPASGNCRAQMDAIFNDDDLDFATDPDTLEPDEIAGILGKAAKIREWLDAVENTALDQAYSQNKPIPGYKVVLSGGKRSILDPELAIKHAVEELGYAPEQVTKTTIRGIGELEALMTVAGFAKDMEPFIKPPTGKPSLVPDADRRPSIQPNTEAAKDFGQEDDVL
jgi:hypothetical protein